MREMVWFSITERASCVAVVLPDLIPFAGAQQRAEAVGGVE